MRLSKVVLIGGILWGLAGPLLLGQASGSSDGPFGFGPTVGSASLQWLGADHINPLLKIALLPAVVGADVAAWTLGVVFWPFAGSRWPGEALTQVLAHSPSASWAVLTVFSVAAGVVLSYGVSAGLRFLRSSTQRGTPSQ